MTISIYSSILIHSDKMRCMLDLRNKGQYLRGAHRGLSELLIYQALIDKAVKISQNWQIAEIASFIFWGAAEMRFPDPCIWFDLFSSPWQINASYLDYTFKGRESRQQINGRLALQSPASFAWYSSRLTGTRLPEACAGRRGPGVDKVSAMKRRVDVDLSTSPV